MQVGEIVEFKGVKLKIDREKSEFSCFGCFMQVMCSKERSGCLAKSNDHLFDNCKRDHVIFTKIQ